MRPNVVKQLQEITDKLVDLLTPEERRVWSTMNTLIDDLGEGSVVKTSQVNIQLGMHYSDNELDELVDRINKKFHTATILWQKRREAI